MEIDDHRTGRLSSEPEAFRIAYDEAVRGLTLQGDRINSLRDRVLTLVTLAAGVIAFLVGAILSNADLDRARGWLAMGTVASALMIVAGLVVATRTKGWQTLTSPWTIYALSRNPKIGDPTELHTEIIVNFDRALETNAPKLERAERAYLGVVALVGLNFVIWLIIAWIVVRPVTGT